jgi:hypothetical protein
MIALALFEIFNSKSEDPHNVKSIIDSSSFDKNDYASWSDAYFEVKQN